MTCILVKGKSRTDLKRYPETSGISSERLSGNFFSLWEMWLQVRAPPDPPHVLLVELTSSQGPAEILVGGCAFPHYSVLKTCH